MKESGSQPSGPALDLALGAVFLLGGIYMVFAFSSFLVFLIGFGCALYGARPWRASVAGALASSGYSETLGILGIPANLRQSLPSPEKERELLKAVKESGAGGVSPTEADAMLSGLAGRGHLAVESENGPLFYSIPKRGPS